MNREQLLAAAATLDLQTLERRRLLAQRQYKRACNHDWLTAAQLRELELNIESDELPIVDQITLGPLQKNDVVVLSDGHCYSPQSIAALVDNGIVAEESGRTMLPASRKQMTDLDYALVGRDAPVLDSQADRDALARTHAVIIDSSVERTREEVWRELEARAARWVQASEADEVQAVRSAKPIYAEVFGATSNQSAMARLLRALSTRHQTTKNCAIVYYIKGFVDAQEDTLDSLFNDLDQFKRQIGLELWQIPQVGLEADCHQILKRNTSYALLQAILNESTDYAETYRIMTHTRGSIGLLEALLLGDNVAARDAMLPLVLDEITRIADMWNVLTGGTGVMLSLRELEKIFNIVLQNNALAHNSLRAGAYDFLFYTVDRNDARYVEGWEWSDADRARYLNEVWPAHADLFYVLPSKDGEERSFARSLGLYGAESTLLLFLNKLGDAFGPDATSRQRARIEQSGKTLRQEHVAAIRTYVKARRIDRREKRRELERLMRRLDSR